ncbi:hypothetical protein [Caballeronia sp. SL2Y3]|uniref:hypothetical protein n=1 Tax=Caballeronia sp. SL2Y3 TaxID=2878151 RepID=UPI001FD61B7D|nr:hypothetical protein [Caballeronia sp. SL2Y3]
MASHILQATNRAMAHAVQRERQQGLGRPIISAEAFGRRLVAVKNRLLYSGKWQTFHDFLVDYLPTAMGKDWGDAELAKPLDLRHPILVWYHYLCEHQRTFVKEPGKVHCGNMTGAVAAYMWLAYDLYELAHNVELQAKLIGRLKDRDNFAGARYEVFVAATLIRAGFELQFENEDDRRSSHCEFTATHKRTGKRFSVEAKHRAGNKFRLGRQLNRALAKDANYDRIVFIDINVPDAAPGNDIPEYLRSSLADLRAFEERVTNGKPLPDAYLIVTNTPWHHHLDAVAFRCAVMADGFQIPDFKGDTPFPSLRAAIDARERHIEIHELLRSIRDQSEIPSTFDGEIPVFAFGEGAPRLIIGQRYLVTGGDGNEHDGLLTTATVVEAERKAYCGLSFEDGTSAICTWDLSDAEMTAWRRHPDTFFGTVEQRTTKVETPLELYDFFLSSYSKTSKDRLLELMVASPDIDDLRGLEQSKLASVYAERCANSVLAMEQRESC